MSAATETDEAPAVAAGELSESAPAPASAEESTSGGSDQPSSTYEVELGALCANNQGGAYCSTRTGGTISVRDSVFQFDAVSNDTGRGVWITVATLPPTTCTAISFKFAVDDRALPLDDVAMLRVNQERSDAYYAEAKNGTIGQLDVTLDGSSMIIAADHTGKQRVRISGVASCSTPNGF